LEGSGGGVVVEVVQVAISGISVHLISLINMLGKLLDKATLL
jgi:hypothetical protein